MSKEHLTLKWGTLKGWKVEGPEATALMQRYLDLGASLSVIAQRDTQEQKDLICQVIDAIDGPIHDDWTGREMTKDGAKKYVMEYGA